MHVAYLTGVHIHQDEPWYLNILCVWVTCKVHKSRKPGDNCMQVTCHSSWKGGRYLQETIHLVFHQRPLIAGKDEQIPDLTLLLAPLGSAIGATSYLTKRTIIFQFFCKMSRGNNYSANIFIINQRNHNILYLFSFFILAKKWWSHLETSGLKCKIM